MRTLRRHGIWAAGLFLAASAGCHRAPLQGQAEAGEAPVERSQGTLHLPACDQVFAALQDGYVSPERLRFADLRRSACARLRLIPELSVLEPAGADEIVLSRADRRLSVACPVNAPIWSFSSCARLLAYAAAQLVPDLQGTDLDRLLAESLLGKLDPHTLLLWGRGQTCGFSRAGCEAEQTGIGVDLASSADGLIVLSVLPEGPAAKAGMRPGDRLVSIDGLPVGELDPIEASWLLSGLPDSQVVVVFDRRGASARQFQAQLTRLKAGKPKLFAARMIGRVAVLRLTLFASGVADEMFKWFKKPRDLSGIVLDLRDNPGGLVMEALAIADLFLDRGAITVIESHDGQRKVDLPAQAGDTAPRVPLVVLTNGHSASASELLSGTLQDQRRALVIGQRTFGKGTAQVPVAVLDGILLMTVERFFTGSGRDVQGVGILPDVELRAVRPDRDQLRWRHWPAQVFEASLQNALTYRRGAPPPDAQPQALTYLDEASGSESDRAVELAVAFTTGIPWLGEIKARAQGVLLRLRQEEDRRVRQALAQIGIQDGTGAAPQPAFEAQIQIAATQAGQEALLTVDLRNIGPGAITGLSCHLESSNPLIEGREIAFDTLEPGKSQRQTLRVQVPVDSLAREDPVRLVWHGAPNLTLPGHREDRGFLRIRTPPKPRLGVDLRQVTDPANRPLCPGRKLRLCAQIKNFGAERATGFVAIDGRDGPINQWEASYKDLEPLAPGSEASVCFTGVGRADLQDASTPQGVRFGDWAGRILGVRAVQIATQSKCQSVEASSRPPGSNGQPATSWSPWLEIEADRLAIEGETLPIRLRAEANGGQLQDLTVYVAGKKVLYQPVGSSRMDRNLVLPVADAGPSLVEVIVRKDRNSSARERFQVYRRGKTPSAAAGGRR